MTGVTNDDRHLLGAYRARSTSARQREPPVRRALVDADGNVVVESENTVVTERGPLTEPPHRDTSGR